MLLIPILLSACATTTTQLASINKEQVEIEKHKQRTLWLKTQLSQQIRLGNIAYPILKNGIPLCNEDTIQFAGLRYANSHYYEGIWKEAAIDLGLGDTLEIIGIVAGSGADKAGMQVGDKLLKIGDQVLAPGKMAINQANEWLESFQSSRSNSFPIEYSRNGKVYNTTIQSEKICAYSTSVVQDGALNAFADGKNIYVTTAMMRFADDAELAVIVAHEFAHNAMGHIDAKRKNAATGAIFGLIGDIAMAYAGVNTGGYYTSEFAKLGAMTFSQDFEREADYVGMYALALAGQPLDSSPQLWRHMAMANPQSIALASSHPTSAERFIRMEQTIQEITEKRAANEPLMPNMKNQYRTGQ